MLFRFSLYGFLKNQRYFEPFLMLVFLDRGLSFFWIGVLVAIREGTVNLLEIPSGAIADGWSRRGSLVVSFAAYIASFLVFAYAERFGWFGLAMILYGIGESFRTGTHKSLIFEWLRVQGRTEDRTEVYGFTRSWSQIGAALSGVLAAVCVLITANYQAIFLFATIPYLLNMVNVWTYPATLDGSHERNLSIAGSIRRVCASLGRSVRIPGLRRLMLESMSWEGVVNAVKDYLQPALAAMVLAWGFGAWMNGGPVSGLASRGIQVDGLVLADSEPTAIRVVAIMVGIVYPILYLLSSIASRYSYRLARGAGSPDWAARGLWRWQMLLFLVLAIADIAGWITLVVLAFVFMHIILNLWRPILISRFDERSSPEEGATILSIESQSQRIATLIVAPLLGLVIDWTSGGGGFGAFWPIGVAGFGTALAMWLTAPSGQVVEAPAGPV